MGGLCLAIERTVDLISERTMAIDWLLDMLDISPHVTP